MNRAAVLAAGKFAANNAAGGLHDLSGSPMRIPLRRSAVPLPSPLTDGHEHPPQRRGNTLPSDAALVVGCAYFGRSSAPGRVNHPGGSRTLNGVDLDAGESGRDTGGVASRYRSTTLHPTGQPESFVQFYIRTSPLRRR